MTALLNNKIISNILLGILVFNIILPVYVAQAILPVEDVAHTAVSTANGKILAASLKTQGFTLKEGTITAIKTGLSAAWDALISGATDKLVIKEYILDPLANLAAQTIIRAMTQQIIGWIQNPDAGFIQNFDQTLRKEIDAAGGEFLNQITGLNLCGNIGAFINISLRTPGLRQRLQCTVTDIVKNVQNFYKNFAQGGWPAFIRISLEPQNNPAGAYLIALDAKIEAETRARGRIEKGVTAGAGFLGFRVPVQKNCVPVSASLTQEQVIQDLDLLDETPTKLTVVTAPGNLGDPTIGKTLCETEYETKTPGSLIAAGLKDAVYSGLDSAKLADEINEAIAAIVTALLNKVIAASSGGGGGIISGSFSDVSDPNSFTPSTSKFFTDKIDDAFVRIQEAQVIVANKLKGDLSAEDKATPLSHLEKLNISGGVILGFRIKLTETTDPNELQNINNQLNNFLVGAEQAIQDATGSTGSATIKTDPNENVLLFADNAKTYAASAILFLEQKISVLAASLATTTATTTQTIQDQSLLNVLSTHKSESEKLLDGLTATRLKFATAINSGNQIDPKLTQDLLGQILKISDKVLAIYKL